VRAVRDGLHVASHLFCSLHAKDNLLHHMTHYGVPQDVRKKSLAIGTDGVSTAADSTAFDARVSTLSDSHITTSLTTSVTVSSQSCAITAQ